MMRVVIDLPRIVMDDLLKLIGEDECYSDPLLDVITLYESGPRGPGW